MTNTQKPLIKSLGGIWVCARKKWWQEPISDDEEMIGIHSTPIGAYLEFRRAEAA